MAGARGAPPARARPSARPTGERLLLALPDVAAPLVAALALPALVLALLGLAHPLAVVGVGAVVLAALVVLAPPGAGPRRAADAPAAVAALLLAGTHAVVSVLLREEHLVLVRDPGVYAVGALEVAGSGGLTTRPAPALVAAGAADVDAPLGFFAVGADGAQVGQGAHLVPSLLSLGGPVAGLDGVLAAGPVVASLALLACWALARRLVGAGWALLVPAGLTLHLGWAAVARGSYTEPTQLVLLAGGLAVAVDAARDGSGSRSLVAGVLLGAAAATRVDGVLVLAALAVAVVVGLLAVAAGDRPPGGRRRLALLVLGAVGPVAVGVVDLTTTVPGYLDALSTRVALALGAAAVVGVLAVPAARLVRRPRVRRALTARRLGTAAVAAVVVAGAVLVSRPLWYVGRRIREGDRAGLEFLQRAYGVEVDGSRSYDEDTLVWVAWYSGVPLLVLAAVGLVAAAWALGARGRRDLLLPLAVLAVAGGAFLWAPSIFPDQVWASRRLLVVVVPGLLLAAAAALALLGRRRPGGRPVGVVLAVVLGVPALLVPPALASAPLLGEPQRPGEADLVADLCRAAEGRAGVVLVGEAVARRLPVTLAAACDVPAVAAPEGWPGDGDLARLREVAGDDVLLVAAEAALLPWDGPPPAEPTLLLRSQKWPEVLQRLPDEPLETELGLWLAEVDGGEVVPTT